MKIPETSTNVGAYYGNEDNGQWQANGVILEGGGAAGGDAGYMHHQHYPVPRQHVAPGYVMAGAYYDGAQFPTHDDFADYMWMENEEEFDKQVMQQLEEEALMEQCIEAMLEDERRAQASQNNHTGASLAAAVSRSTLNPLAAEFVPTFTLKEKPAFVSAAEGSRAEPSKTRTDDDSATEKEEVKAQSSGDESTSKTPETAQESDATQEKRPKEKKEVKKSPPKEANAEVRKPATTASSDTKVAALKKEPKKEVKATKSAERTEESRPEPQEPPKCQSPAEPATGFKPFNYAAAAKAKPKKLTEAPPPQNIERPVAPKERPTVVRTVEKPTKSAEKIAAKDKTKPGDKSRKNPAK